MAVICCSCGCGDALTDHGDPRNLTASDVFLAAEAAGINPVQAVENITASLPAFFPLAAAGTTDDEPGGESSDDTGVVVKAIPEQRYVLGVAYQAGPDPRIQRGADGGLDYFTADELEKAAWSYIPAGATVGLFHEDGSEGAATVTESYIYRGPDWAVGDAVVKAGDWLVGAVLDEPAWALFKSGRITGWSPQGTGRRRKVSR